MCFLFVCVDADSFVFVYVSMYVLISHHSLWGFLFVCGAAVVRVVLWGGGGSIRGRWPPLIFYLYRVKDSVESHWNGSCNSSLLSVVFELDFTFKLNYSLWVAQMEMFEDHEDHYVKCLVNLFKIYWYFWFLSFHCFSEGTHQKKSNCTYSCNTWHLATRCCTRAPAQTKVNVSFTH